MQDAQLLAPGMVQISQREYDDAQLCKQALLTICSVNKLGCKTPEDTVVHDQSVSDLAFAAFMHEHARALALIEQLNSPQDLSHLYVPLPEDDVEHYGVRIGVVGYED